MKIKTRFTGYTGKDSVPMPEFQHVEMTCPFCRNYIRIPIMDELVDKQQIIDNYKEHMKRLHSNFNALVEELIEMFPDKPIREFMEGRKKEIMNTLHRYLNESK